MKINNNLIKLEKKLKYFFKNKNLLIQAISHKSFNYNFNNEKLEFLGDSILNFIITKKIYNIFFNINEGDMTKIKCFLVSSNIITKIFNKINILNYVYIKNFKSVNEISNSIIENIFESIIAAIFLDSDIDTVEKFIFYHYTKYINLIIKHSIKVIKDSKTTLQEITKKIFFSNPNYILNKIENYKNNKKIFHITCEIHNNSIFFKKCGLGFSKKKAEKLSAKKMIGFIKYKKLI